MSAPITNGNLVQAHENIQPAIPEIKVSELQAALDAVVLDSLGPVSVGIGALYVFFAIAHMFFLPPELARVMSPAAAATAVVMFGLRFALNQRPVPARWAHPIAGFVAAMVLLNTLLRLYLDADLLQITNVMLLIVGAGFLLLSARWLALVIGVSLAGLAPAIWLLPPSPNWQHFGFAMISTIVLSGIVHAARIQTMRRLERLRIEDKFHQAELEAVLASTERSRRALELSLAVGQRLVSILDLDTLLTEVAELIKERFGYYYVGIFLVDESGACLVARGGTGEAGHALCREGFCLKIGEEGIIGWVAQSRQAVCVDDVSQDNRYMFLETIPDTQSELVLPLISGEKLLGVLDIQSDQLAVFKEDDVPVIQSLADQVAIAIQNASLYQREQSRRRLAETLYKVGQALSGTLDPREVLDLILEQLADIVPYDRAAVMLPSENGEEMEFVALRGFPAGARPQLRIPIRENDIFHHILVTQRHLIISDVSERPDWQYVEGLPRARSWLGVPLTRSNQVVGMLSLTRERPTPYQDEEVTLANTFAGQAAVALENARLYDQVSRAYDQLERLDRTKSDFISVVAHELRTPLTVFRGSSQMLLNDPAIKENEFHHQLVSSIFTGVVRLHEIVNAMLDMAKIDSRTLELHPELVSLPLQIRLACDQFKAALAERNLSLQLEDMSELPKIEADTELLDKIFYQLIINAIKYTPDGGTITISGHPLPPGRQDMLEGGVEIIVSDTGIGIDPQFHELIFAKFYQTGEVALHSSGKTKFKGGGPGLGLAIAKGIIEAHGGKVWAESPGHDEETCPGSQFHVVLPLRQSAWQSESVKE